MHDFRPDYAGFKFVYLFEGDGDSIDDVGEMPVVGWAWCDKADRWVAGVLDGGEVTKVTADWLDDAMWEIVPQGEDLNAAKRRVVAARRASRG